MVNNQRQITIVWSVEDVQEVRPDLTDKQCIAVLKMVKRKHDAEYGVTWETLKMYAEEQFSLN